jgi:hypothetical protein
MPPKAWRWSGRGRTTADGSALSDPTAPHPTEELVDGNTQPDRLHELAAEQASGALYLNGRWGGTIFLRHGRIAQVESVLTPGVEALLLRPTYTDEHSWAALVPSLRRGENEAAVAAAQQVRRTTASAVNIEILRRIATADAALAALGTSVPEPARTRARFRPGEKHWCAPARTYSLAEVLGEVRRRKALLDRMTLGVHPERLVLRVPRLPVERVRLTATQWNITRAADGARTPLDIAWLLGHSVFATTLAVHQLARLGVLTAHPELPESHPLGLVPARHALSFVRAIGP